MNDILSLLALQFIVNVLVAYFLWRHRRAILGLTEDMNAVVDWVERDQKLEEDFARAKRELEEGLRSGRPLALPPGTHREILRVRAQDESPFPKYPIPLGKHTLLVGLSGSGKSNTVSGYIIASLEACNTVWIIDTKDEHEQAFGRYCRIFKRDEAVAAFDAVLSEGERRRELFKQTSKTFGVVCRDHLEYFNITGVRLEQLTLIVEEMFDLSQTVPFDRLAVILSTTRSAGINIVGAVQYINNKVMPVNGSANFQVRVYMGAWNWRWVQQALGDLTKFESPSLQAFVGPVGRALVKLENGRIEKVQIPEIDAKTLNRYLRGEH